MKEQLKQGQRIRFEISDLKGDGKIVGVANNGHPIIGVLYIIEPDIPINNSVYNYSHIVAWENQFQLI